MRSTVSDLVCPHYHREFSGEQMTKFREDVAGQKRLNQLKDTFMKESGWEARINKSGKLMLLCTAVLPIVLYAIVSSLLMRAGGDVFLRYFGQLLSATMVSMVLLAIVGVARGFRLGKKRDEAFNEWRLMSGN